MPVLAMSTAKRLFFLKWFAFQMTMRSQTNFHKVSQLRIEGAHEGRGLGTRFLRHIERNSVLLFMIPADSDDLKRDYAVLLGELTQYNPELLDKQRLLAITKCDMLDDELIEEMKSHLPEGVPSVFISSVSGLNIPRLKDMLWEALQP